ncbi:MAG: DSD1 family PLP-dependent enzyme [Chloroflexi bacterium]|nr:DSD1 family PLP-dependent enzyme [Chloroflexota bacterium]
MSVGGPVSDLDTPALLVDLDILEGNIRRMAGTFKENGVAWRPHTKAIKIPAIAYKLLEAGAHGITCAKLSEAEVMVASGIKDILITGPVVGARKCARLACLSREARPIAVVDCVDHVDMLDAAAREYGVTIRTAIEVDIGLQRVGVQPGEPAVALAREIARREGLSFTGLMAWEGHALRITPADTKLKMVEDAVAQLVGSANQIRAAGIPVEIISCGGTGTYPYSAQQHGITEIEAGGGVYGDLVYRDNFNIDHPMAMTVVATVISRPNPTRIVTDAGFKSLSTGHMLPRPKNVDGVKAAKFSAEHGTIELEAPDTTTRVGDRIEWYVGYTDSTVVLHDMLYGIRAGIVESAWPILGRGKLQ